VPRAGVVNNFCSWTTLGFYLCLAGQIQVKYDFTKLKWSLRDPDGARGPLPGLYFTKKMNPPMVKMRKISQCEWNQFFTSQIILRHRRHLIRTWKEFWTIFLYFQLQFDFLPQEIGEKAACKILVKLTPGMSNWRRTVTFFNRRSLKT
jgi:hypothetical protein